jgi:hypothetical protein
MVATDKLFVGKIPEIYDRLPRLWPFPYKGVSFLSRKLGQFPLRQRIISVRPR